jgi:hypothetical protein
VPTTVPFREKDTVPVGSAKWLFETTVAVNVTGFPGAEMAALACASIDVPS